MKKILSIALATMLLLAFTACGKTNTPVAGTFKEGESLQTAIEKVDAKFAEKYGEDYAAVAMPMPIDEAFLSDFLGLSKETYDEFAGNFSMSMTNSDAFFAVKAKDGKLEAVQQGVEKRLADLKSQYEQYPVSGSYDRALAGEVYTKGNYVFLIVVGVLDDMEAEAPDFSDDVKMTKETIDSLFNA